MCLVWVSLDGLLLPSQRGASSAWGSGSPELQSAAQPEQGGCREEILQLVRTWGCSLINEVSTLTCKPLSSIIGLLMRLHEKENEKKKIEIQAPKIHEL